MFVSRFTLQSLATLSLHCGFFVAIGAVDDILDIKLVGGS